VHWAAAGCLRQLARQPPAAYAATWRRAFAELPSEDFPLSGTILDELPHVAGAAQFEGALIALASGLANAGR
jgi:hypothetical protein